MPPRSYVIRIAAVCAACVVCARASAAQRPGVFLGDLTWPEAERRLHDAPMVILPFGAGAKEHGPHLPLGADQIVMEYLARVAADSLPVVVAPPILHGWFPAFAEFPGLTIDDPDVFWHYVLEAARSLVRHGARRVVFLNTGVTRSTGIPIALAARTLHTQERVPTLVVSWDDLETAATKALTTQRAGTHADEIETSVILALRPELVHMERAVRDYHGSDTAAAYPGYRPTDFSRRTGDPDYSTTGVFGDPTLATAAKGRKALGIMTEQWVKALRGFATSPLPSGAREVR
jgi:creatinine amidohydrolase